MRLFVSIRPPQPALDHLDAALSGARAAGGRALRWTDPEQWHLTLAFASSAPEGALDDLGQHLGAIAADHEPFGLHLSGAGVFSGRTLWVGVGGATSALEALMAEHLLGDADRERRRGHLTVARVSSRAPSPRRRRGNGHAGGRGNGSEQSADPTALLLADAVRALSVYRGPDWTAHELEIVSSRLGEGRSGGPLHEVLARVPLGAGAAY